MRLLRWVRRLYVSACLAGALLWPISIVVGAWVWSGRVEVILAEHRLVVLYEPSIAPRWSLDSEMRGWSRLVRAEAWAGAPWHWPRLNRPAPGPPPARWVTVPLSVVCVASLSALAALGLGHLAVWPLRVWRRRRNQCARCSYSLEGLTSAKCPECGEQIPRAPAPPPGALSAR